MGGLDPTLLMEGLDLTSLLDVDWKGRRFGRIRSMLLLLIDLIDAVVVDCSDRCCCCGLFRSMLLLLLLLIVPINVVVTVAGW